jgi:predicted nucleic acid-binding protein
VKLVVDANTFVSGLLWQGAPAQFLELIAAGKGSIITSPELRDPKDLPVLACAIAVQADAIVSGDNDLLVLRRFSGIPIINAREAVRWLSVSGE